MKFNHVIQQEKISACMTQFSFIKYVTWWSSMNSTSINLCNVIPFYVQWSDNLCFLYLNPNDIHENSEVGQMIAFTHSVGQIGVLDLATEWGPLSILDPVNQEGKFEM